MIFSDLLRQISHHVPGRWRWFRLLPAMLLPVAAASCSAQEAATVTVDPAMHFQTIESWEATAKMWEFDKKADRFDGSWLPIADQILTRLIDEGGINRLRLEIRSGAENPVDYWTQFRDGKIGYLGFKAHFYEKINDNDDPRVLNPAGIQFSEIDFRMEHLILPAMRIAKRLGRPMKVTLCYVDFRWTQQKGTLSHADKPEEYAELIAATFAHLKAKYGLAPDRLEIILEPDNSDRWRGKQIGEAILAVTKRLEEQGARPAIIAPSTSIARATPIYFDALNSVPGAAHRVNILSYHRYGGKVSDEMLADILKRARKIGAETAMLEYTHSDVDDLFDDLTKANVSSWQKYGITMIDHGVGASAPGNMLRVAHPEQARPEIDVLPMSMPLAQIFRAVDSGALRIGARSDRDWVRPVAFRNPDGRMVVSVKANRGIVATSLEKMAKKIDMTMAPPQPGEGQWVRISGLAAGRYAMQRSNALAGGRLRCQTDVKQGEAPAVYLRGADVATLTEQRSGAPIDAPRCSSDANDWR